MLKQGAASIKRRPNFTQLEKEELLKDCAELMKINKDLWGNLFYQRIAEKEEWKGSRPWSSLQNCVKRIRQHEPELFKKFLPECLLQVNAKRRLETAEPRTDEKMFSQQHGVQILKAFMEIEVTGQCLTDRKIWDEIILKSGVEGKNWKAVKEHFFFHIIAYRKDYLTDEQFKELNEKLTGANFNIERHMEKEESEVVEISDGEDMNQSGAIPTLKDTNLKMGLENIGTAAGNIKQEKKAEKLKDDLEIIKIVVETTKDKKQAGKSNVDIKIIENAAAQQKNENLATNSKLDVEIIEKAEGQNKDEPKKAVKTARSQEPNQNTGILKTSKTALPRNSNEKRVKFSKLSMSNYSDDIAMSEILPEDQLEKKKTLPDELVDVEDTEMVECVSEKGPLKKRENLIGAEMHIADGLKDETSQMQVDEEEHADGMAVDFDLKDQEVLESGNLMVGMGHENMQQSTQNDESIEAGNQIGTQLDEQDDVKQNEKENRMEKEKKFGTTQEMKPKCLNFEKIEQLLKFLQTKYKAICDQDVVPYIVRNKYEKCLKNIGKAVEISLKRNSESVYREILGVKKQLMDCAEVVYFEYILAVAYYEDCQETKDLVSVALSMIEVVEETCKPKGTDGKIFGY